MSPLLRLRTKELCAYLLYDLLSLDGVGCYLPGCYLTGWLCCRIPMLRDNACICWCMPSSFAQ